MSYATDFAHPDPIVREVIDVWLPRFLGGGISIGDLTNTLRRVETWDDWGREWMATGDIHETRATEAAAAGRTRTAAEAWETAARCHHLAYFLSVREPAIHDEGLERMLACYGRAMPGLVPAVEKVTIEGPDDLRMVALLSVVRPGAPVVIVLPGLDSTKETRHSARGGWMSRGFSVLSLDGPGQGEASRWSAARHDYEWAITATIDWLEAHPDIDASRIGLFGSSLGGYYAPRAAALEPRITAVVGNCGPFNWAECWEVLPAVTREAFAHYARASDLADARRLAEDFTLEGVMEHLDRPLLVVHGDEDPLIPWQQGRRIVEEAGGPAEFVLVAGGNHGISNLRYRMVPLVHDWMVEHVIGT
ncbi:alpha/beta hydrolase family protein [Actinomycetota bacterium]